MRKLLVRASSLMCALVVLACGGGGGVPGLTIPPIPTGLTAVAGDTQALLTWNLSNGATHYNVKRSTTSGGPYTLVSGPSLPTYTDSGLVNGTPYYYVVSADSVAGESGNSSEVTVTPQGAPGPVDVSIGVNFSPVTIQARVGQVVRWTNNDVLTHTVTGDTADGPDSSTVHAGGLAPAAVYSWQVPIGAPVGRVFYYHCAFHGASGGGNTLGVGMAGAIEVVP